LTEPLLTRWPFNKLIRERALEVTMKHIHYEDENTRYIDGGCVNKVIIHILFQLLLWVFKLTPMLKNFIFIMELDLVTDLITDSVTEIEFFNH